MSYLPNGGIQYKKVLTISGQKHRMSVCARTPTMALKLMREKEKKAEVEYRCRPSIKPFQRLSMTGW